MAGASQEAAELTKMMSKEHGKTKLLRTVERMVAYQRRPAFLRWEIFLQISTWSFYWNKKVFGNLNLKKI